MIKILIADDEPIERALVNRIIEKNFPDTLQVFVAENGRRAVEIFEEEHPQIFIFDIEMPGINGLEAAKKIRELGGDGEIVFLTAYDEFDYARTAISVRALDYLLKPTEHTELVAVIETAIGKVQAEGRKSESTTHSSPVKDETDSARLGAIAGIIQNYIEEHYMDDLSLQDVADQLNYSEAYFCKIFKQCFGQGFTLYLSEYRIARAKEMLSDIAINIKDISERVGYRDSNYFAKVFKRAEGMTPSEYRNKALSKDEG